MNAEQMIELRKLVLKIDWIKDQVSTFGIFNDKELDVQSTIRYLGNASASLRSIQ